MAFLRAQTDRFGGSAPGEKIRDARRIELSQRYCLSLSRNAGDDHGALEQGTVGDDCGGGKSGLRICKPARTPSGVPRPAKNWLFPSRRRRTMGTGTDGLQNPALCAGGGVLGGIRTRRDDSARGLQGISFANPRRRGEDHLRQTV